MKEAAGEKKTEKAGEVCSVCGDRATGIHYRVQSCEGCKVRPDQMSEDERKRFRFIHGDCCIGLGVLEADHPAEHGRPLHL